MSMPKQSRQRSRKIFLPPRTDAALTYQQFRAEQQAVQRQRVAAPKVEMLPEMADAMAEMRKQMMAQLAAQMDRQMHVNPLQEIMEMVERLHKPQPQNLPRPPREKPRRYLLLLPPRKQ